MKKELVVKDNALINASYTIDLVEQRVILLAIIAARETNTPSDKDLTIHAETYINQFGVHKNTAYEGLKNACKSLFERRFSYQIRTAKGNIEHVTSRWVQKISYVENEGLVRIRFSEDVLPLITRLEQQFTSYELEQVSNLSSAYAVRLYELLSQWRAMSKTPIFPIWEFRQKIGVIDNDYMRMDHFKSKVLDFAITQINTHTDIMVSYEQHKAGRTITGFSFTFKNKTPPKAKEVKKLKEAPLDGVSLSSCDKVIARFNALSLEEQENVMTQVQSGMKGRALAQFNAALSAYKTHPSPALFEEYEAYFKKAL